MAFRSEKNNLIFIHIMKTGGTFIRTLYPDFVQISSVHASAFQTKQSVSKEIWDNSFKFGVVRDPYEMIISLYRYLNDHPEHADHLMSHLNFQQFLKEFETHKLNKGFYKTQKGMLYNGEKCLVDKVFKQEEMYEAMKYLHENHGAEFSTKKVNTSNFIPVHLTKENRSRINRMFKEDFKTFGYSMK